MFELLNRICGICDQFLDRMKGDACTRANVLLCIPALVVTCCLRSFAAPSTMRLATISAPSSCGDDDVVQTSFFVLFVAAFDGLPPPPPPHTGSFGFQRMIDLLHSC